MVVVVVVSGEFCISEDKSPRRMRHMTQSSILLVTSPNVHRFKKIQ